MLRKAIVALSLICLLMSLPGCMNYTPDVAPLEVSGPNSTSELSTDLTQGMVVPIPGATPIPVTSLDSVSGNNAEILPFCETESGYIDKANCVGDNQYGYWRLGGRATDVIELRVSGKNYYIFSLDGKLYISCELISSPTNTTTEISQSEYDNILKYIDDIDKQNETGVDNWNEFKGWLIATFGTATAGCIGGAIAGQLGWIVGPGGAAIGALAGCGIGVAAGVSLSTLATLIQYVVKTIDFNIKLSDLQNGLNKLLNSLSIKC